MIEQGGPVSRNVPPIPVESFVNIQIISIQLKNPSV